MYHIPRGVDALRVVYYVEFKLPVSFTAGSHCYLRGVNYKIQTFLCSLKR